MALTPLKRRAISLLSMGNDVSSVAATIEVSRMTLCRWKRDPEFQRALDKSTGEMQDNMLSQVQNTARVMVEGALDSANELRHIILNPRATDHDKRLAACNMLKHVQRFWDMLGFSAKLPNRRKLNNEELEELDAAESIDQEPRPGECEPGDRDQRPEWEIDPVPPGSPATALPDEYYSWKDNPIHEDGTPKTPSQPEPEPEPEPEIKPAAPAELAAESTAAPELSPAADTIDDDDSDEPTETVAVPARYVARPSRAKGKVRRTKPAPAPAPRAPSAQRQTQSALTRLHNSAAPTPRSAGILPASP